MTRATKSIKYTPDLCLIVQNLEKELHYLLVFVGASFSNLLDHKPQLGFAIILAGSTKLFNCIQFFSYDCKRVLRSILGGNSHAFVDAFDQGHTIFITWGKI